MVTNWDGSACESIETRLSILALEAAGSFVLRARAWPTFLRQPKSPKARPAKNTKSSSEEQSQNAGTDQSAEHELLMKESAQEVRDALMKLPEKLRVVLILKEYEGMNYKEIAKVLGITEGNVKVRAFRAREALFSLLNEGGSHVSR